ncbi:MAG: hypothetical protein JXB30_09290 [Anaerolineae bacterium]|nr:hypothetical protein [Anaerolineae bacterium]
MPQSNNDESKRKEEVVEGEIVAEFRDETLMHLPKLPDDDEPEPLAAPGVKPPSGDEPPEPGRRQFIVRLAMGGVTALALGGSAALLLQRRREPSVVVLPNGTQVDADGSVDVASLAKQVARLQDELEAVTAERDQYRRELANVDADPEELRMQLSEAQHLNDLWRQLDDVGLDDLLSGALQVVSAGLAAILSVVELVRAGLSEAENRLDTFVANFPGPQDGIAWLQRQLDGLSDSLDQLAEQVQEAIEPVEPYAEMIANFVLWVLERLPFGVGAKAKAGLEGMQAIITGLPSLVSGVGGKVFVPLADWFGDDTNRNLLGILVSPLSEKLLKPAQDMLTKLESFQTDYENKLASPAQAALEQRAGIREQIRQAQVGLES